jgi:hypothetical protein
MIIELHQAFKLIVSATVLALVSSNALAETAMSFTVAIPIECVELAQRQNVPVVIENRYQARVKLAKLRDSEPNVYECRAALERAKVVAGFST